MTALIEGAVESPRAPAAAGRISMPTHAVASLAAERTALVATLTRGLANTMLDGVQRAAQLNFDASRHLLGHARHGSSDAPRNGDTRPACVESLDFARRTYEVCAITASRVLRLCHDHLQCDADRLWHALDAGLDRLALDTERARAARSAFAALRASHDAYFEAMVRMHEQLRGLAEGVTVADAPS